MNSSLNPEAPEFYPDLTSQTKDGFMSMSKTIRSSNSFPLGSGYSLFKTITDFNILTQKLTENVLLQAEKIIATEMPNVKLNRNDKEYNEEKIIEANDRLVDRVHINIDTITGVNKPNEKFLEGINPRVAGWNKMNHPQVAKIKIGATTFIGGRNIPRPQLHFKDAVDNSDSLWVPKIKDKPNNKKPLALKLLYNLNGEPVGYEHPYETELENYQPGSVFIYSDCESPKFPPPLKMTEYTYVDTQHKLDELVDHLKSVYEIAFDLEHHSYRTYQGITCLIQISTKEGGDFIIDALALREHIHKLNIVFTDPKILKVAHGALMDVLWLQRDFGVYVVGLFDTFHAAKLLNEKGLSYKYLLMKYCEIDIDKRHQLADWRLRPLPNELVEYARVDTHYLLYIYKRMKEDLISKASHRQNLIQAAFEQSRQTCCATYHKATVNDNSHLNLYVRSRKTFDNKQLAALQLLYKWRDTKARELDESTTYVLPNHMLLSLAENLPREVQGVDACCSPMPPIVRQNLIVIHRMILSCRELPTEPQLYRMPSSVKTMAPPIQRPSCSTHDLAPMPEDITDVKLDIIKDETIECASTSFESDFAMFTPPNTPNIVPNLNVNAESFIPPYDRYKAYRTVAQNEELKEFKKMEEKIAALSTGNELIKSEVLGRLERVRVHLESEVAAAGPGPESTAAAPTSTDNTNSSNLTSSERSPSKTAPSKIGDSAESLTAPNTPLDERKRKMPTDKTQATTTPKKSDKYKNVDYGKFLNKSENYKPQMKRRYKNK